jgi:hypothetical protein
VYLRIVETELGLPRLSRDLIRVCNLCMRLLAASVGAYAITSLLALSPLLAISIGECVSWCFVPALPVRKLFAVGVVAIPALSSPSLKIVAPPQTNLVALHDVGYRHCSCVTRDLVQDRIRHCNSGM